MIQSHKSAPGAQTTQFIAPISFGDNDQTLEAGGLLLLNALGLLKTNEIKDN